MRVIVVGGGWAGLAAAMELCAHGADVTLLEAAGHLGGRARAVRRDDLYFDNGQHLLIGAYHETLRLLALAGVAEEDVFARHALHWRMHSPGRETVDIAAVYPLPAPLHMLWALLRAGGYTWKERLATLRACATLFSTLAGASDITVRTWLRQTHQPGRVVDSLWAPLCLATLNTPIEYASAEVFTRVLRDAFLHRRADADMLLPRCDLGAVFPTPAARYIENRGGHVVLNARVNALITDQTRVTGVQGKGGAHMADHVILALPAHASAALLAKYPALAPLVSQLRAFDYEPICTAYLRAPSSLSFTTPMVGMAGTLGQWLFDLRHAGNPGWIGVVMSGPGDHMPIDNEKLMIALVDEIATLFGVATWPVVGFVIREKRATFSCRVEINARRPRARSGLPGLWLAGDYTDTGYPATLEGAVRSGVNCARAIHASR